MLNGGRKSRKIFSEYLIQILVSLATLAKVFVKRLAIYCGLVTHLSISIIVERNMSDDSSKDIVFFDILSIIFNEFQLLFRKVCY